MKSTISLHQPSQASVLDRLSAWSRRSNLLMSYLVEENVTNLQALLIWHVLFVLTLICTVSFVNPLYTVALAAWLAWSISLCQKGGLK